MSAGVTASVYQGLVSRIASGAYPVGSLLPGCRVLARELGVNKNTVARAFKTMQQRGLIRGIPGVGMMVTRVMQIDDAHKWDITAELSDLVRHARATGMQRRRLEHTFRSLVDKWYASGCISVALVECNIWDARSLALDIQSRLGVSVTPMLLDDFLRDAAEGLPPYDLFVTTFYHLTEIYSVVPESQRDRLVAIGDNPSVKSLLAISEIPKDACIAIVAGHERTVSQLERTLESCGHKAAYTAIIDDAKNLKKVLRQATVVVESERCHSEMVGLELDTPLIIVSFEMDSQSLAFLRKRIDRLMADMQVAVSASRV